MSVHSSSITQFPFPFSSIRQLLIVAERLLRRYLNTTLSVYPTNEWAAATTRLVCRAGRRPPGADLSWLCAVSCDDTALPRPPEISWPSPPLGHGFPAHPARCAAQESRPEPCGARRHRTSSSEPAQRIQWRGATALTCRHFRR